MPKTNQQNAQEVAKIMHKLQAPNLEEVLSLINKLSLDKRSKLLAVEDANDGKKNILHKLVDIYACESENKAEDWALTQESIIAILAALEPCGIQEQYDDKNLTASMYASRVHCVELFNALWPFIDLRMRDSRGTALVLHLVLNDNISVLRYICEKLSTEQKEALLNSKDNEGAPIIHCAICVGVNTQVIDVLLENGALVHEEIKDNLGQTALTLATLAYPHDKVELIKKLLPFTQDITKHSLDKYLQPNEKKKHTLNLLQLAALKGMKDLCELYIEMGLPIIYDELELSPVSIAYNNKHKDCARSIIQKIPDLMLKNSTYLLHMATHEDDIETMEWLMQKGLIAEFRDRKNNTPIHIAIEHKKRQATEYLIGCMKRLDVLRVDNGNSLIDWAVEHNNMYALKLLLAKKIKFEMKISVVQEDHIAKTPPAIYRAVEKNNISAIHLLAKARHNVHVYATKPLSTIKWHAQTVKVGELQCSEEIVRAGNIEDWTPLHEAACAPPNIAKHMLEILVEHGADIHHETGGNGINPLLLAISHCQNRPEAITYLLENGADPDEKTHDGMSTALMHAINIHSARAVEVLLKYHANPNLCCNGITPLELAYDTEQEYIVMQLLAKGADYKKFLSARYPKRFMHNVDKIDDISPETWVYVDQHVPKIHKKLDQYIPHGMNNADLRIVQHAWQQYLLENQKIDGFIKMLLGPVESITMLSEETFIQHWNVVANPYLMLTMIRYIAELLEFIDHQNLNAFYESYFFEHMALEKILGSNIFNRTKNNIIDKKTHLNAIFDTFGFVASLRTGRTIPKLEYLHGLAIDKRPSVRSAMDGVMATLLEQARHMYASGENILDTVKHVYWDRLYVHASEDAKIEQSALSSYAVHYVLMFFAPSTKLQKTIEEYHLEKRAKQTKDESIEDFLYPNSLVNNDLKDIISFRHNKVVHLGRLLSEELTSCIEYSKSAKKEDVRLLLQYFFQTLPLAPLTIKKVEMLEAVVNCLIVSDDMVFCQKLQVEYLQAFALIVSQLPVNTCVNNEKVSALVSYIGLCEGALVKLTQDDLYRVLIAIQKFGNTIICEDNDAMMRTIAMVSTKALRNVRTHDNTSYEITSNALMDMPKFAEMSKKYDKLLDWCNTMQKRQEEKVNEAKKKLEKKLEDEKEKIQQKFNTFLKEKDKEASAAQLKLLEQCEEIATMTKGYKQQESHTKKIQKELSTLKSRSFDYQEENKRLKEENKELDDKIKTLQKVYDSNKDNYSESLRQARLKIDDLEKSNDQKDQYIDQTNISANKWHALQEKISDLERQLELTRQDNRSKDEVIQGLHEEISVQKPAVTAEVEIQTSSSIWLKKTDYAPILRKYAKPITLIMSALSQSLPKATIGICGAQAAFTNMSKLANDYQDNVVGNTIAVCKLEEDPQSVMLSDDIDIFIMDVDRLYNKNAVERIVCTICQRLQLFQTPANVIASRVGKFQNALYTVDVHLYNQKQKGYIQDFEIIWDGQYQAFTISNNVCDPIKQSYLHGASLEHSQIDNAVWPSLFRALCCAVEHTPVFYAIYSSSNATHQLVEVALQHKLQKESTTSKIIHDVISIIDRYHRSTHALQMWQILNTLYSVMGSKKTLFQYICPTRNRLATNDITFINNYMLHSNDNIVVTLAIIVNYFARSLGIHTEPNSKVTVLNYADNKILIDHKKAEKVLCFFDTQKTNYVNTTVSHYLMSNTTLAKQTMFTHTYNVKKSIGHMKSK